MYIYISICIFQDPAEGDRLEAGYKHITRDLFTHTESELGPKEEPRLDIFREYGDSCEDLRECL